MTRVDTGIEDLVRRCIPLVHAVVGETARRVPRHVSRDELRSAGMLGLVQAARSWDGGRGVAFEAYARPRIHGAVLDELRSLDWASRSARAGARRHQDAVSAFVNEHGRSPSSAELAGRLGTDVATVHGIERDAARASLQSLELAVDAGQEPLAVGDDPGEALVAREVKEVLRSAIDALPERLKVVVVEYFFEERAMQAIADDLGVTESRVSQMRGEALALVRDGMNAQLEPERVPDLGHADGRVGRRKNRYYAAVATAHAERRRRIACTA